MCSDRPAVEIRAIVPTGFGINCEAETAHALRLAGACPATIHLNDLAGDPAQLARARILVLAGGFSFGDHLGAGKVYANRILTRLGATVAQFVADGGLVLGICNGFQTLARLGLVPRGVAGMGQQTVGLAPNRHGCFYNGWVSLAVDADSPCVFTRGIEGLELPVRHGEGRLVAPAPVMAEIDAGHLAPLRYSDPATDRPAGDFPANPNGSAGAVAGLCDASGRVFGLMPHPEAYLYTENHPRWRRDLVAAGGGLQMFVNAVECARGRG